MTRLAIVGSGGHGAVVAEAAVSSGDWSEIIFLDDDITKNRVLEFEVAGRLSELKNYLHQDTRAVVAIGDNRRRLELIDTISQYGGAPATIIHPSAIISPSAMISAGCVVFAGVIVNARARLSSGCIVNTAATIDHDCLLESGVHVSPGANLAGGVRVGACAWIGIGASVRQGISIGEDSIVGAGAAVVADVGRSLSVGGVPAKELTSRTRGD